MNSSMGGFDVGADYVGFAPQVVSENAGILEQETFLPPKQCGNAF